MRTAQGHDANAKPPRAIQDASDPTEIAPPVPEVVVAREVPRDLLDESVRRRDRVRIARGVYVAANGLDIDEPARARAIAVARAIGLGRRFEVPHVFSHETAALLWDLPTWRVPASTHAITTYRAGTRHDPMVRRHHVEQLSTVEATERHGVQLTTLARTVVDCATSLPALDVLVIADAALGAGLDPSDVRRLLDGRRGHRGVRRAREVLDLADGGAESPGETATRFVVLRDGLPTPETQLKVETRIGVFRGDLGWRRWRLLVEYDGRSKYQGAETLVREKRRHDTLVEAGWTVLRVTKEDLRSDTVTGRVVAHLATRPTLSPRPQLLNRTGGRRVR